MSIATDLLTPADYLNRREYALGVIERTAPLHGASEMDFRNRMQMSPLCNAVNLCVLKELAAEGIIEVVDGKWTRVPGTCSHTHGTLYRHVDDVMLRPATKAERAESDEEVAAGNHEGLFFSKVYSCAVYVQD